MINLRYKPYFLPQISAPYTIIADKLNQENIGYEESIINPNELNPMQGIVFSDEIDNSFEEETPPIWISNDNEIIDGHHRFVKHLMYDKPIKCIKIHMNGKDGARILNKIQDIYEYEQQLELEETVNADAINMRNDIDTEIDDGFDDNLIVPTDPNNVKVFAFRNGDINENSVIGNFFMTNPNQDSNKYEIDFDNLLEIDQNILGNGNPVEILFSVWFPNVNIDKLCEKYDIEPLNLKNLMIKNKAEKLGYDGIKYGENMIQGFK